MRNEVALRRALEILNMEPADLHAALQTASGGDTATSRSTVTRWLNGSSPVPAALKLWLRDRLIARARRTPRIALHRCIVVGVLTDKVGAGALSIAFLLAAFCQLEGINARYVTLRPDEELVFFGSLAKSRKLSQIVCELDRSKLPRISELLDSPGIIFVGAQEAIRNEEKLFASNSIVHSSDYIIVPSSLYSSDINGNKKILGILREHKIRHRLLFISRDVPSIESVRNACANLSEDKCFRVFDSIVNLTTISFDSLIKAKEWELPEVFWKILQQVFDDLAIQTDVRSDFSAQLSFEEVVQKIDRENIP